MQPIYDIGEHVHLDLTVPTGNGEYATRPGARVLGIVASESRTTYRLTLTEHIDYEITARREHVYQPAVGDGGACVDCGEAWVKG